MHDGQIGKHVYNILHTIIWYAGRNIFELWILVTHKFHFIIIEFENKHIYTNKRKVLMSMCLSVYYSYENIPHKQLQSWNFEWGYFLISLCAHRDSEFDFFLIIQVIIEEYMKLIKNSHFLF